jgi:hypothetical protein
MRHVEKGYLCNSNGGNLLFPRYIGFGEQQTQLVHKDTLQDMGGLCVLFLFIISSHYSFSLCLSRIDCSMIMAFEQQHSSEHQDIQDSKHCQ